MRCRTPSVQREADGAQKAHDHEVGTVFFGPVVDSETDGRDGRPTLKVMILVRL